MKFRQTVLKTLTLAGALTFGLWKLKALDGLPQHIGLLMVNLLNEQRKRHQELDYVSFTLPSHMAALPSHMNFIQRRLFGDPPLSLAELELAFRRIAADERLQGVILNLPIFGMPLADLQTLRQSILSLREKGKRVICYSTGYNTLSYYVASAADDIIMQPGGTLHTIGLQNSLTFMRDALASIGIEVETIAISPYKSAADTLTHQDISPELREQVNWLLDSIFEQLSQGIAEGRDLSLETVQALVDDAPYTDLTAHAEGYIDAILNEEELPNYLSAKYLIPWEEAEGKVLLLPPPHSNKIIAVLPLEGLIVDGESASPPDGIPVPFLGAERMGSLTVVQQVRNLMQQDNLGAVVLFVDSGGGSATASEAMASALAELAKQVPLIVYMNGVAASGGYYISTPAQWIVAQPATLTGSIGVIMGKVVNTELFKKLRFNSVDFMRGHNANLESPQTHFSAEQREQIKQNIDRTYGLFMERVAASRHLSLEAVNAVSEGRVWTGAQALQHGLVDQLGGLQTAVAKARELAKLPEDAPAVLLRMKLKPLGPQLAEQANPAALLRYGLGNLNAILNGQAQLLMPWQWD